jgi:hypothetical protein
MHPFLIGLFEFVAFFIVCELLSNEETIVIVLPERPSPEK